MIRRSATRLAREAESENVAMIPRAAQQRNTHADKWKVSPNHIMGAALVVAVVAAVLLGMMLMMIASVTSASGKSVVVSPQSPQEKLAYACTFLRLPNLTECLLTTKINAWTPRMVYSRPKLDC